MWMQSPFITDQAYRLHFMAAEVKRVAFLCPTLPTKAAEALVVPSHHQACQHKTLSLSGFRSLYNWSELRTHVSQFRVILPDNLSIFGMICPETNASCSRHTGAFMATAGEAAGSCIKAVTIKEAPHSLNGRAVRRVTSLHACFSTSTLRKSKIKHYTSCKHGGTLRLTHAACKNIYTHTYVHTVHLAKAGRKDHLLKSLHTS